MTRICAFYSTLLAEDYNPIDYEFPKRVQEDKTKCYTLRYFKNDHVKSVVRAFSSGYFTYESYHLDETKAHNKAFCPKSHVPNLFHSDIESVEPFFAFEFDSIKKISTVVIQTRNLDDQETQFEDVTVSVSNSSDSTNPMIQLGIYSHEAPKGEAVEFHAITPLFGKFLFIQTSKDKIVFGDIVVY